MLLALICFLTITFIFLLVVVRAVGKCNRYENDKDQLIFVRGHQKRKGRKH